MFSAVLNRPLELFFQELVFIQGLKGFKPRGSKTFREFIIIHSGVSWKTERLTNVTEGSRNSFAVSPNLLLLCSSEFISYLPHSKIITMTY